MTVAAPPFQTEAVAKAFQAFPEVSRRGLLNLRALIFDTAAGLPEVGPLTETLKWGQPAYLTEASGSGTTIRLGVPKTGGFALHVHCQSRVMAEFAETFPDALTADGTRGVVFRADERPPDAPLRLLIASALRYRLTRS